MNKIKVLHVNFSSSRGGAARAVFRINEALNRSSLSNSKILYVDHNINFFGNIFYSNFQRLLNFFKRSFIFFFKKIEIYKCNIKANLSYNFFNCNYLVNYLNTQKVFDIINLHWINGEMLSIKDISNLKKNFVWTFHDMWPFSGSEHISIDDNRWIKGYKIKSFFDFSAKTWIKKKNCWNSPMQIVAPSSWLKHCVNIAKLTKHWPVSVIPNTIDTKVWKINNKSYLRKKFNINKDIRIVMFSALGGGNEYYKGKDLLIKALKILKTKIEFEIIVVGENFSKTLSTLGIKTYYFGHITDDYLLSDIYNCADVCVVPSRVESFCLTALEAQSCGIPVVSFNVCGLKDIIINKKTGFLARPYSYKDLEKKILLILSSKKIEKLMSKNARQRVLKNFSYPVVAKKYNNFYLKVIKNKNG
jgi:glycosyltransferase involved in cell wall biosynthesis